MFVKNAGVDVQLVILPIMQMIVLPVLPNITDIIVYELTYLGVLRFIGSSLLQGFIRKGL